MPTKSICIEGRVVDPAGRKSGVSLRVEAWDKEPATHRTLASTITGAGGHFCIELRADQLKQWFGARKPEFVFKIYERNRQLSPAVVPPEWTPATPKRKIAITLSSGRPVQVGTVSKDPGPAIAEVLGAAAVKSKTVTQALARAGVQNLRDLFLGGAKVKPVLARLKDQPRRKLMAVAKFAAATKDLSLGSRIAATGIRSLTELAAMPLSKIERTLGTLTSDERTALQQAYLTARTVRSQTLNFAIRYRRSKSMDGSWYASREVVASDGKTRPSVAGGLKNPKLTDDTCYECSCCDNAFSPRAYLYDLLDLIYYWWNIFPVPGQLSGGAADLSVQHLEQLFLQPILSLDCDVAMRPVPQVCLAAQILEQYLGDKIPVGDPRWKSNFYDTFTQMFGLDALPDFANGQITASLKALVATASPTAATCEAIYALLKQDPPKLGLGAVADASRQELEYFAKRLDDTAVGRLLADYRDRVLIPMTKQDVETLQRDLFIDLENSGCQVTTRIEQLILSAQSFILAGRTGDIVRVERPDLSDNPIDFQALAAAPVEDMSWHWLGNYSTWLAAMYTFVYPENILPPTASEGKSPAYGAVIETLQSGAGPTDVRQVYLDYIFPRPTQAFLNYLLQQDNDVSFLDRIDLNAALMQESGKGQWEDLATWLWAVRQIQPKLQSWVQQFGPAYTSTVPATTPPAPPLIAPNYLDWEFQREQNLFFPLLAGWALNRSGNYAAAHDWYRQLYDPEKPEADRYIYDFDRDPNNTTLDQSLPTPPAEPWLEDPLDPAVIADNRPGVYLRHTILSMVRNLLDWADHEYSLANPESLDRARELYLLARRVLQAPDLGGKCSRAITKLVLDFVTTYHMDWQAEGEKIKTTVQALDGIRSRAILDQTISGIYAALQTKSSTGTKANRIEKLVQKALVKDRAGPPEPGVGEDWQGRHHAPEVFENALFFKGGAGLTGGFGNGTGLGDGPSGDPTDGIDNFGLGQTVPSFDPGSDWHSWGRTNPQDPHQTVPSGTTQQPGGGSDNGTFVPVATPSSITLCVPANPLLKAMSLHIEANLSKLAHCLGIAGEPLPSQIFTCGTSTPYIGALAGQSAQPQAPVPTDQPKYRYSFLVDKARQYVDVAQRLEAAFLMAEEKVDDESLRRLQARQAVETAEATVTLRQLSVREAQDGSNVVDLQQQRAQSQLNFWDNRIAGGMMNDYEKLGLGLMLVSGGLQLGAAGLQAAMIAPAIAGAFASGAVTAGGGAATFAGGAVSATGVGAVAGGWVMAGGAFTMTAGSIAMGSSLMAGAPLLVGAMQSAAGAASTFGSAALTYASFQRRWEDWGLQHDLANWDNQIAGAQVVVAHDHVQIASQEAEIARLEQTHSREVLAFLMNKFSDVELYQWMVDVLQRNYRAAMQIAADLARLAQSALEFERQQTIEFVKGDYWSLDASGTPTTSLTDQQKRSGLLGAERLLTDLTKLDAYKVETDKRRLQIAKTISLARMLPYELVSLRQNGTVTFNTLMPWFDADFPGHYLRLIKSVRVTLLALVPPIDGIHAMLSSSGESSVVVQEWNPRTSKFDFNKKRAARKFGEEIALHSGFNETGLFVFNYDDPMLLPFEGLGVETQWKFDLPRGTNAFNFDTIADVLLTIEYTALNDADYGAQVRTEIGSTASSDVAIPVSALFPDQWYQLMNPPPNATGARNMVLKLGRGFFPPNLKYSPTGTPGYVFSTTNVKLLITGDLSNLTQRDPNNPAPQTLQDTLVDGITVSKGTLSLNADGANSGFKTQVRKDSYAFLSTQLADQTPGSTAAQPVDGVSGQIDPVGDWTIELDPALYTTLDADGKPLLNRIRDLLLVITLRGTIDWPAS